MVRPRDMAGKIWARLTLWTGQEYDVLMVNDLLLSCPLDGFFVEIRRTGQRQRPAKYFSRESVREIVVLGVSGTVKAQTENLSAHRRT